MKLKSYLIKQKHEAGDYKIKKVFAWWPKRVENKLIWLESYKRVYKYTIRQRPVFCQGYGVIDRLVYGDWDFVTEQLIES
jgi:hypothetical protein